MTTEAQYDLFISYSRRVDRLFAHDLQRRIERFARPFLGRRKLRVYRDDSSLPLTHDLWAELSRAVENSSYLLLLASPESAASIWVSREIEQMVSTRGLAAVGVAVTAGTTPLLDKLPADEAAGTSLSPTLIEIFQLHCATPFLLDLRGLRTQNGRFANGSTADNAVAYIVSRITGRPKDEVFGEHLVIERKNRRLAVGIAAALLILLLISGALGIAAMGFAYQSYVGRRQAETLIDEVLSQVYEDLEEAGRLDAMDGALEAVARYYAEYERVEDPAGGRLSSVYYSRGEIARQKGDFEEAEQDYRLGEQLARAGVRLYPEDASQHIMVAICLDGLSQLYFVSGRVGEGREAALQGISEVEIAIGMAPQQADAYDTLGNLYASLGDAQLSSSLQEALASYDKSCLAVNHALEMAPDRHALLFTRALCYLGKGDALRQGWALEDALVCYQKAVADCNSLMEEGPTQWASTPQIVSRLAVSLEWQGQVLWLMGRSEEATEAYRQAVVLRQQNADLDRSNATRAEELRRAQQGLSLSRTQAVLYGEHTPTVSGSCR